MPGSCFRPGQNLLLGSVTRRLKVISMGQSCGLPMYVHPPNRSLSEMYLAVHLWLIYHRLEEFKFCFTQAARNQTCFKFWSGLHVY